MLVFAFYSGGHTSVYTPDTEMSLVSYAPDSFAGAAAIEGGRNEGSLWGVRGSVACPDPCVARYGGNTSCVEVRAGSKLLIFDSGTGLRHLGKELVEAGKPVNADIFYSHCHIDHVCGLPFFAPCYLPSSKLRLWAGHLASPEGLEGALRQMMSAPLFPTGFDSFKAQIEFRDFRTGEVLAPAAGLKLRTAPLNHPGGATGYRVDTDRSRWPTSPIPSTGPASSTSKCWRLRPGSI